MRVCHLLSGGAPAPHRQAQIVPIHLHHQPRISKRLQPRANLLCRKRIAKLPRHTSRRLCRITNKIDPGVESRQHKTPASCARARVADQNHRPCQEKVESRSARGRPFRPPRNFFTQRPRIPRRLPPIGVVKLKKISQISELLTRQADTNTNKPPQVSAHPPQAPHS